MNYKNILTIIGILFLGVVGGLVFQIFVFPYILSSHYFENFGFVKLFKEGRVILNPVQQVYIQENSALENSIEKTKSSVVAIHGLGLNGKSFTVSGFVATSDGLIVAMSSLVTAGSQVSVYLNDQELPGMILKRDKANDLVLIKVDKNDLATVGFADFSKIKLGQKIFFVGVNSIKKDDWITDQGVISFLNQDSARTSIWQTYEISGSPLFNIYGELVGISYVDDIGRVWFLPSSKIKEFLGL